MDALWQVVQSGVQGFGFGLIGGAIVALLVFRFVK
jgi:hypothetical protein